MTKQIIITATFALAQLLLVQTLSATANVDSTSLTDESLTLDDTRPDNAGLKSTYSSVSIFQSATALFLEFEGVKFLLPQERVIEIFNEQGRRVFKGIAFSNTLTSRVQTYNFEKGNYTIQLNVNGHQMKSDFEIN